VTLLECLLGGGDATLTGPGTGAQRAATSVK